MAEQHVRAVQKRRSEFDETDFQLVLAIATDMGRSDEPARTSQRSLAERAGCHYNTAGTRIEKLVARGVVVVSKNGRQHFHTLPTIITDCHNPSQPANKTPEVAVNNPAGSPNSAQYATITDYHNLREEHCDYVKRTTEALEAITSQLSQLSSQIATMHQRLTVVEDKIEEIQSKTPLTPQGEPAGKTPAATGRKRTEVVYEIPAVLDTPEFRAAWGEFVTHRRQLGKKLTELAAKKQLETLEGWGLQRALLAIPYSISQGWTGIYEPKPGTNGLNGTNGRQPKPAPSQGLKQVEEGVY